VSYKNSSHMSLITWISFHDHRTHDQSNLS